MPNKKKGGNGFEFYPKTSELKIAALQKPSFRKVGSRLSDDNFLVEKNF
jgi:hypothetical protein